MSSSPLDSVLKQYQRVSQMISCDEFVRLEVGAQKLPKEKHQILVTKAADDYMAQETGKLYKAIDEHGNVFLITNPATWRQDEYGVRHRPAPQPMGKIEDLKKESVLGYQTKKKRGFRI